MKITYDGHGRTSYVVSNFPENAKNPVPATVTMAFIPNPVVAGST